MIVFDLVESEQNETYRDLEYDNLGRQYNFLDSIVNAAVSLGRPMISTAIIKALNFHAIACLHGNAGEYRPCRVTVGKYVPPQHFRVPELMNAFVNEVNYRWESADPVVLATYVLWRLNSIHPFVNGNGRTARALCYYVICVKFGGPIQGNPILPELILQNRDEYITLLKLTDKAFAERKPEYLTNLCEFIVRLLREQIMSG